jgi:hypothetical protein
MVTIPLIFSLANLHETESSTPSTGWSRCENISYIEIEGEGVHAGGGERRLKRGRGREAEVDGKGREGKGIANDARGA